MAAKRSKKKKTGKKKKAGAFASKSSVSKLSSRLTAVEHFLKKASAQ
jgi:hypothetical protein